MAAANKEFKGNVQSTIEGKESFILDGTAASVKSTTALKSEIEDFYKDEFCTSVQDHLSAITIGLPKENTKIAGLYYQFFKRLAWEGISLYEVVSTTNEFTILVEDEVVDTAFSAIKSLKN